METVNIINFDFWIIIKILILIALGLYIIFAFVITRQVKVMTATLTLGFESISKILAWVHLFFVAYVFFTALTTL